MRSKTVKTDKAVAMWIRKKPGFEAYTVTFTVDAQGVNVVVDSNTNNLDWNNDGTETIATAMAAVRGAADSGGTIMPMDAKWGDSKDDDVITDNSQIVDATSITMIDGVWYPVYWDISNTLFQQLAFDEDCHGFLLPPTATGTGSGSYATTLYVYSGTDLVYTETLSSSALTATALTATQSSWPVGGIETERGKRMLIKIARANNVSDLNIVGNMRDAGEPLL